MRPDPQASAVPKVLAAHQDIRAPAAKRASLARWGREARRGHRARPARQAPLERKAIEARKANRAQSVRPAPPGGQISFSTTYIGAVRVDARKASASPFYKPWATQATTISGQTVEVTALQELDE